VTLRETQLMAAFKDYPKNDRLEEWPEWATGASVIVKGLLKDAASALRWRPNKANRDRVFELEALAEALEKVAWMDAENWVLEMTPGTKDGRRWEFNSVWPGALAESRLFMGVPKVVLMSGTLRPATMRMLGIKKEESEFREWPRVFPAQNTPVYHVPTVRMNAKVDEAGLGKWVERIDEIIDARQAYKGIIHTVSYARQKYLLAHSRHAPVFYCNTNEPESDSAKEIVEKFKAAEGPAILVSPSFGTGWDFPGVCRWMIVAKMPFPEFRSKVMQARLKKNPAYTAYICMQELVQMAGRCTRSEEDRCQVIIVDDSVQFFMRQNKGLAPEWFRVMKVGEVPGIED
jgi:Rad3-related DNA helicase